MQKLDVSEFRRQSPERNWRQGVQITLEQGVQITLELWSADDSRNFSVRRRREGEQSPGRDSQRVPSVMCKKIRRTAVGGC